MLPPRSPRVPPMPWYIPTPPGFHPRFETPDFAEKEDQRHIRILRKVGGDAHLALADRLAAHDFHENEPTLASSRFMRVARIRLLSTAAPLLEQRQVVGPLSMLTVIPAWFTPEDELATAEADTLKQRFRQHLLRERIAGSNGLFIGHLEAAYCRQRSTKRLGFAFHVHGVFDDNATAVMERLRDLPSFAPTKDVRQPIRRELIRDADLRHVLGYCFMTFWRSRAIVEDPEGIDDVALPRGGRLPDEAACREWLWRDRQSLADMSIVVGTRAMSRAFRHEWL